MEEISRSFFPISYLIEDGSIRRLTGQLVHVQEDHWHPLAGQLSPQPEPKVSPSTRHHHLACGDARGQCRLLSRSGRRTLRVAYPVAGGHRRAGGDGRGGLADPRLVGGVAYVGSTGLQATKGDTLAGKLLHLAEGPSALPHVGATQLHECPAGWRRESSVLTLWTFYL